MKPPKPRQEGPTVPRPYCLRCYAPMKPYRGSCAECPRCTHLNLRVDQRLFWTQERRLRELEQLAKVLIVIFLGWVGYLLLPPTTGGVGMGQGWAVGFPILFGYVLWETASKITRRKPYFRAAIVWTILLLIFGLPVLAVGVALCIAGKGPLWGGILVAGIGFAMTVLGVFCWWIGAALERWKTERILRGGEAG